MHKRILLAFLFLAFFPTITPAAAPCSTATPPCIKWVGVGPGSSRGFVYRTHALDARNPAITRALVLVHGHGRNAASYFRTAIAAATRAGALEDTLIVAPRFSSSHRECTDELAPGELNWTCDGPESWRSGGPAISDPTLTSFDMGEAIVRLLAREEVFPRLRSIVIAGHSAGGQYTTRYAMANRLHDSLRIPVTYVVANPSSYTYPDDRRPSSPKCAAFDNWPYGLQNRRGYSAKLSDVQLVKQVVSRPTTFLVGELDILPQSNFDASCPAMAQGANRLERGLAYARHLNEAYGAKHRALVIPGCGHSARCMFTADRALPVLFPQ
jgi:pimeloyl-ACP methyl ester carboxylesterase